MACMGICVLVMTVSDRSTVSIVAADVRTVPMACMGIFGRVMTTSDKWTRTFMSGRILDVCNIHMVLKVTPVQKKKGGACTYCLYRRSQTFSQLISYF